MRLRILERVAVLHHARRGVVALDLELVAQTRRDRRSRERAIGNHHRAANRQRLHAICRHDLELAFALLRRQVGLAALAVQRLLVHHRVTAARSRRQIRDLRLVILDADRQRRIRQVAIGILDRVREHVILASGTARRTRVVVRTIGIELQLAMVACELHAHRRSIIQRCRRAALGNTHHLQATISSGHVLLARARFAHAFQHVASHSSITQLDHIRVQLRRRYIVHDPHRQHPRCRIPVLVLHGHGKFHLGVVPAGVVQQRVRVVNLAHTSRSVILITTCQRPCRIRHALISTGQHQAAQLHLGHAILGREVNRARRGFAVCCFVRTRRFVTACRQARFAHFRAANHIDWRTIRIVRIVRIAGVARIIGIAWIDWILRITQSRHRIRQLDRQRRLRRIAIAVLDGVAEHISHTTCRALIARVFVRTIRLDRQIAIRSGNGRTRFRDGMRHASAILHADNLHRPVRVLRIGLFARHAAIHHVAAQARAVLGQGHLIRIRHRIGVGDLHH